MKTLPVCDEDSLKDGEMWVHLIADALGPYHRRIRIPFRTLTQISGRKSILVAARCCW